MPKSRRRPADKKRRPESRPPARPGARRNRPQNSRKKPADQRPMPGPLAAPAGVSDPDLALRVLDLVRQQRQAPPSLGEIARSLRLRDGEAASLARVLHDLEIAGDIVRVRQDRFTLPQEVDLVVGTVQLHRDGSAHLLRDLPGQPEFYLSPENTATALPGDRVVVRHLRDSAPYRGYQPCGRVIRILQRGTTTTVGTLEKSARFWHVVPDDKYFVHNIYVPQPAAPLRPNQGDKVVVKLGEWTSRHVNPEGEIIEVLGPADKPGIDIESIIRKFDLPTKFPEAVLSAADAFPETVPPAAARDREDCRDTLVITIDPDDARDFDDAIHVEVLRDGWRLTVHIADVSHYVTPGTPLDHEAYQRGNSVYLPDRVIPMLPEALSNGLCSLRPNEDRLAFAAFLDIGRDGRIRKSRFAKTIIRSARRLTYKEAYARLQAKPGNDVDRMLHEAWAMASTLRKKRFEEGSLDLDFPEVKVWLDDQGRPARLERIENDISHQLIEECMLAANEAVARLFRMTPAAAIHRVHEKPDEAKLNEYRERVQMHGHKVGNLAVRKELTRFLKMLRGQPEEYALKTALLKSLKRASYSPEPAGHYGLAKTDYTHFTSPIRRYADLIVHRVLSDVCGYTKPKGRIPFTEIARHISTTERNAAEAEREAVRLKKVRVFPPAIDQKNRTNLQSHRPRSAQLRYVRRAPRSHGRRPYPRLRPRRRLLHFRSGPPALHRPQNKENLPSRRRTGSRRGPRRPVQAATRLRPGLTMSRRRPGRGHSFRVGSKRRPGAIPKLSDLSRESLCGLGDHGRPGRLHRRLADEPLRAKAPREGARAPRDRQNGPKFAAEQQTISPRTSGRRHQTNFSRCNHASVRASVSSSVARPRQPVASWNGSGSITQRFGQISRARSAVSDGTLLPMAGMNFEAKATGLRKICGTATNLPRRPLTLPAVSMRSASVIVPGEVTCARSNLPPCTNHASIASAKSSDDTQLKCFNSRPGFVHSFPRTMRKSGSVAWSPGPSTMGARRKRTRP